MIKELKDIKPIVEIHDNSIIIFAVTIFSLIILLTLLYLFLKPKRKRRKKPTSKEINLENLKSINFGDDKDIAYTFTTFAEEFIDKSVYQDILKELEEFKYKKQTPPMPETLKSKIKNIIKDIK